MFHGSNPSYLQEKGIFVSVINPYKMNIYRKEDLRRAKTDKIDSKVIANYGIDHWFRLEEYCGTEETYEELKLL